MKIAALEEQLRASGPTSVACPFCRAKPTEQCRRRTWNPKTGEQELVPCNEPHQARVTAAELHTSELQKLLDWERGCQP